MMEIKIWVFVVLLVGLLLIGAIAGFFISRKLFTKYMEKNPPINEKMIRAMFISMGRTPSEKQAEEMAVFKSLQTQGI